MDPKDGEWMLLEAPVAELARIIGVDRSYLHLILNGKVAEPRSKTRMKIQAALGLDRDSVERLILQRRVQMVARRKVLEHMRLLKKEAELA